MMRILLLKCFLLLVYFLLFLFLIDLVFRNTLSILTDILAVICWVIAFIASVELADYTVKKLSRNI